MIRSNIKQVPAAPRTKKAAEQYRRPRKKAAAYIALLCVCICGILGTTAYLLFIYSNIPFVAYWRSIYIETAMTTGDHQWLATAFIPRDTIQSVMQDKQSGSDNIGGQEHLSLANQPSWLWENGSAISPEPSTPGASEQPDDILGQRGLNVGDTDYAGNKVLINDIEEGLVISEIVGNRYKGMVMLVDDPSRVILGCTKTKGVQGTRIVDMMEEYGAVAGINASGFADWGGNGTGGEVIGLSCSSGEYWGTYVYGYASIVLTGSDKLVAGNFSSWSSYDIRDGMQFGPVLIANGVVQVTGSAGYGLQPRTAIGQREDGVIIMLIVDGRDPLYSVGCTVGDMAQIMASYGAVNAGCCDGGSSTVLAYGGQVLNRNSSANPKYGRRIPNAFLVMSKKDSQE